jgi:hypothetical protein
MDEYENVSAPLKKIGASQSYGALDRLLEQSDLEAKYNDFMRKRKEMAMPLDVAGSLAGGTPFPSSLQQPQQTSQFNMQDIMGLIQPLLSKFLGGGGAGGGGAGGFSTGQFGMANAFQNPSASTQAQYPWAF